MPLAEIVFDFYDRLKPSLRGMHHLTTSIGYRESHLVKVDVMLNGDPIDALALLSIEQCLRHW